MRILPGKIASKLLGTICSLSLLLGHPLTGFGSDEPRRQAVELQGFAFGISGVAGEADLLIMVGHKSVSRVDAKTGKVLWSARTPTGTIDSAPLIAGDVVLYSGGGGNFTLYGLDAQNGRLLWRQDHKSTVLATDGERAFVNEVPGKNVLALSPRSGKKVWLFEHVGPDTVGQILYYKDRVFTNYDVLDALDGKRIQQLPSESRAFTAASGMVFSANPDDTVEAIDAVSRTNLWTVPGPRDMNPIAITAHNDHVVAAFYAGYEFSARTGVLRAYAGRDGRQLWEVTLRAQQGLLPSPIGMDDKFVYVSEPLDAGHESRIRALDLSSGREVWSFDELEGTDGPPVPLGDEVYLTAGDRKLLVLDRSTGKQLRTICSPDTRE